VSAGGHGEFESLRVVVENRIESDVLAGRIILPELDLFTVAVE
jgi:hypothetical protein